MNTMPPKVAGASNVVGQSRFALERWDSPRHSSQVAQLLFSLAVFERT
jgi:hypothetical protein